MNTWKQFKDWLLAALITGAASWALYDFHELRVSVQELNVNMASTVSEIKGYGERISLLERAVR